MTITNNKTKSTVLFDLCSIKHTYNTNCLVVKLILSLQLLGFGIINCQSQDTLHQETITTFYKRFKLAQKDITNYIDLFNATYYKDNFSTDEKRAKFYYLNNNPKNYIVSFPLVEYFLIKIMIDPCKGRTQYCCDTLAVCEMDNTDIISGNYMITIGGDLEAAWFTNNFIPFCENEFNNADCGSFLEIHLPASGVIIYQLKLTSYYINGFKTVFLSTKNLCAGRYEVTHLSKADLVCF